MTKASITTINGMKKTESHVRYSSDFSSYNSEPDVTRLEEEVKELDEEARER